MPASRIAEGEAQRKLYRKRRTGWCAKGDIVKLKLDDKGNVVLLDGKPVYVKADGSEVAFDVEATSGTITRLNSEAQRNRERAEGVEKLLKVFTDAGVDDAAAAAKALQIVSGLDAKKLIDAGEVEKVKLEIQKAFQVKLDEQTTKSSGLEKQLYEERVGGAFGRSKYITEKLMIPSDIAQAVFGKHFTIENGKTVAKDGNGNPIFSASNPGELAGFDESLGILVGQYPNRDQITKGSGASGGGAPNSNNNANGKKNVTRAEFDKLDVLEQRNIATLVGQGKATLTD